MSHFEVILVLFGTFLFAGTIAFVVADIVFKSRILKKIDIIAQSLWALYGILDKNLDNKKERD